MWQSAIGVVWSWMATRVIGLCVSELKRSVIGSVLMGS